MPYEWQTAKPDVCPTCNGKGYTEDNTTTGRAVCNRCAGSGILYRMTYTVAVEPLQTMRSPYELIDELRTEIAILKARIDELEREAVNDADTSA